ncbi:hypothetical protein [Bdellovibrio reynosensis]|uniref:Uncharacterized protein n=1 Tax=Bdellovibrio reynosensis TaxID=2835041 RepID=A0ABY4C8L8_9BACT|nr:hypothetical protein [Bdellovibrio reynosensis]UOF01272.1 hypothetical protein MNR06_16375 [Bdellovibrio reynosensis]
MTDNAQRTDANKESDFFFALGTSNRFTMPGHVLGLRLKYQDYSNENPNDVLSYGISDEMKCLGDKTCEFEFKGQEYVYGEPATTDYSFTNYALAGAVTKTQGLKRNMDLDLTAAAEVRNYPSLNRLDTTAYFRATLGYDATTLLYLEANGESGLVISSASEYSLMYFDISGMAEYAVDRNWTMTGELGVKQTVFLNRDLTTETTVTRRNGRTVSLVDTSKETYNALYLSFEGNYTVSLDHTAGIGLRSFKQNSRSGYQDYTENEIIAKWLVTF